MILKRNCALVTEIRVVLKVWEITLVAKVTVVCCNVDNPVMNSCVLITGPDVYLWADKLPTLSALFIKLPTLAFTLSSFM